MDKKEILDILDNAKDERGAVPMRLVRQAFDKLPTIQPEKTQPSREGATKDATSDLISKTETVEHLRRVLEATVPNTDYDEGFIDGVEFGISTVSAMPTIQPVATNTNVGDKDGNTINRMAVELLDRFAKIFCKDDTVTDDLVFHCKQCAFEMPDGTCLVKVMAARLCPDYKDFGSMGDL